MRDTASGPVTGLHTLTTGWAEMHPEHRDGSRLPTMMWVLISRQWVKAPINATLIEHRDGVVLFDTGLDPAIAGDPDYVSSPIGRFLSHRIFRFHIGPDDALDRQLAALGFAVADVKVAVLSHLHFDHVGGIARLPQADLLVSEREWQILSEPHPEREWILRAHIELPGARWRPFQFAAVTDPLLADFGESYDVMGDGALILLPTPGHTPGSLSMLIRSAPWPPILLVGDLTFSMDRLMNDQVAGTGDPAQLRASYAKVRALKRLLPDLIVVPAHDPAAAETLAALQSRH